MEIDGNHCRTIWIKPDDENSVQIIDQRRLPHEFVIEDLKSVDDIAIAIREMHLRGAPLIGAAAAYGMVFAVLEAPRDESFRGSILAAAEKLKATRPTAVNLFHAVDRQVSGIIGQKSHEARLSAARRIADEIIEEDVEQCRRIGDHGLPFIEEISRRKKGAPVNILTHCNAGWLACVDHGTATAPIYAAFDQGIDVYVWVDETRPRNQGARLTAWELGKHGIPHTVITDSTSGHLMQTGLVDIVFVGTDRTTRNGDVGNKIGTYLVALAAADNNVPFYVGLPSTSIDWSIRDGIRQIPIEQRNSEEVRYVQGLADGKVRTVLVTPRESAVVNYAFDVTPSKYVTGLITERGVCPANEEGLLGLFPEMNGQEI